MYFYQPSQGHGLPHDPLNAIIDRALLRWIASRDSDGRHNLAPYSFFNCFNYHPPIIGFASSGWKDSVQNIIDTGEFVWNLTTLEAYQRDERNVSQLASMAKMSFLPPG